MGNIFSKFVNHEKKKESEILYKKIVNLVNKQKGYSPIQENQVRELQSEFAERLEHLKVDILRRNLELLEN